MKLLNPTHESAAESFEPPARLTTLNGTTVGIISNGKEKTAAFFDHAARVLVDGYGVAKVVRRVKDNYSAPAPQELMAQAMGWDAVLAGVGD